MDDGAGCRPDARGRGADQLYGGRALERPQDPKLHRRLAASSRQARGQVQERPPRAFQQVFVDDLALEALFQKRFPLPEGVILVKENYMPDGQLAAITVMQKIAGFNPEGGDWSWAKYAPDGSVQASGQVGGCIGCHAQKKASDWIFSGNK